MEGLLNEYFIAKEQARTATERKNTLERKIKEEQAAGNLQNVWDDDCNAYIFDNAVIRLSERKTYAISCYSNKVQEMIQAEKDDGTAQPNITTSLRIEIRD